MADWTTFDWSTFTDAPAQPPPPPPSPSGWETFDWATREWVPAEAPRSSASRADWITVSSSWLHSYQYEGGTLFIRFKDKQGRITATCMYQDVPLETWLGLLESSSKGRFLYQSGLVRWPYTLL